MNRQQPFQQQKKGSLRWLWISLAVLGVVMFISLVLVIVFIAFLAYSKSHQPVVGDAMKAAGQYYTAIENHDYTIAYNYLDRNATITVHGRPIVMRSVETLATTSRTLDTQDGVITGSTAMDGNFEPGKNIVDLTMKVTRNGQSSDVHVKIELVGSDWKILSADGI
ncbi:MAG TPA: hypothetical protein VHV10_08840 [Ktedonobacteraceae bacterium]|nr:hypothetical protein [Ktedonobacteraceae bacterium]